MTNNFTKQTKQILQLFVYFCLDASQDIQICCFPERAHLQPKGSAIDRSNISRASCHRNYHIRSSRANVTSAFSFSQWIFHVRRQRYHKLIFVSTLCATSQSHFVCVPRKPTSVQSAKALSRRASTHECVPIKSIFLRVHLYNSAQWPLEYVQ